MVQSEGTACPIETNYTLHLSTMDGTAGNFSLAIFFFCWLTSKTVAVASMDYSAPEMLLMFDPCVTQSCVSLPIKDDGVLEYVQENFTVHLAHSYELATKENLTSRILLGVEEATVAIRDDEPGKA